MKLGKSLNLWQETNCFQLCFWSNRLAYDKELEKEGKIAVITPDYSHWVTKIPGNILMVPSAFGGIYQTKLQPVNTLGVIDEDREKLSLSVIITSLTKALYQNI